MNVIHARNSDTPQHYARTAAIHRAVSPSQTPVVAAPSSLAETMAVSAVFHVVVVVLVIITTTAIARPLQVRQRLALDGGDVGGVVVVDQDGLAVDLLDPRVVPVLDLQRVQLGRGRDDRHVEAQPRAVEERRRPVGALQQGVGE